MMDMAITTTNVLGLADLEAMPDDGRRYELVGGAIVMTPAPAPGHQLISVRLLRLLEEAGLPEGHTLFHAPIDLDLPGEQRVQPDLVVLPWSSVGEQRLVLPVLLVVEIVSAGSRTHDSVTKRAVYAEAGIPAYWLVNPTSGEITALRLDEHGNYLLVAQGASVRLDWPMAINLDMAALTDRPLPPRPS